MALLDRVEKAQKAVYWPPKGQDQFGRDRYGDAVEIGCFWMDVSELFLDENGAQQVSNAKVIVDTDLKRGGLLRLGDMASLTYAPDPNRNDNVHKIRKFERRPANIEATKFLRKAYL